ncbi:MAG: quinoprotein glucose dehydrogenase [Acidobacteriaceae bacterium]|jgi:glucose dehydrogenase|nr:quinoprotein glucose dehydrogenase [Acidobacteriaceae bacterium]
MDEFRPAMRPKKRLLWIVLVCAVATAHAQDWPVRDWPIYGGQKADDHYSPLTQINRSNVGKLKVAWSYDSGEKGVGLQTSPLIVGRTLYAYTPTQKVIALDAATGKLRWTFDSGVTSTQPVRGLTWWSDGSESRLFAGVANFLYALDPRDGKPIQGFGEGGRIDLRKNLRGEYREQSIALTTPGIVYRDLIIVGGRMPETHPAPPGDIRAFDVRTGALRWSFHTIPHPGEEGYDTWPQDAWLHSGAANNWTGMALDEKRGILYVPTGSAVSDFYGADRTGQDLFADTLLALDAATGKRVWSFQGVHHDIWDRDFPSPPSLLTVTRDGKRVDAVAQAAKQGYLYLFDRVTGRPLFPIVEQTVPASNVPGEKAWPTQPRPLFPAPFARQYLTGAMLTDRTPEAHAFAEQKFKSFRSAGQFVPFSVDKQTIVFPGFDGGAEWGGSAVDIKSGVIYINANEMAWTGGLTANKTGLGVGEEAYDNLCASCHGDHREGSPPAFPSLIGVDKRLTSAQITSAIRQGKGRMPAFPMVNDTALPALIHYLEQGQEIASHGANAGDKQEMTSASASIHAPATYDPAGAASYAAHCAICHGDRREGISPSFPALMGIGRRMSQQQVLALIHQGKGRMPGFPKLQDEELAALLRYMDVPEHISQPQPAGDAAELKYRFTGYRKFLDQDGYPAIAPPWGTLNAIDLNTGRYLWKIPFGEYPELAAKGMKETGTENYGGPVVTAGGLVFIGATIFDRRMHAFDSHTGKLLWESTLPFAGHATPATYMLDGRQYVVIAAGGGRDPKWPSGGVYVAFALPSARTGTARRRGAKIHGSGSGLRMR